jgi:hypothetical protein
VKSKSFCNEAFDETIEPWSSYVERLGQYFKANKVDDSLKVASLLSLIGGKTYNLLRTLTSPTKPAEGSIVSSNASIFPIYAAMINYSKR